MEIDYNTLGIKYEEYKDFDKSRHRNVYQSAFAKLNDIVKKNQENKKDVLYSVKRKYMEFPNIISFVGKRGSGKTSAMLSFMESLRDYHIMPIEKKFSATALDNASFVCLECIDGSLLEKGEDIFKVVLAQMYEEYQKSMQKIMGNMGEQTNRARDLSRNFEELFKTISVLDGMSKGLIGAGESYMSSLRTLSRSQKIKQKFEDLTKEYLAYLRLRNEECETFYGECYLVITVDDVDLNIQNGFEMLEKIHHYLMIPNIIVLLSMDYEQMLSLCKRGFYEILPQSERIYMQETNHIQRVAMDYLEKVIPYCYRVYMRTFYYANEIQKQEKMQLFTILYQKSGVAFDADGLKRHFYEPKSLRESAGLFLEMEYLKNVNKDYDIEILESNYAYFHSDLRTRMCSEIIEDSGQRSFFEKVLEARVDRSIELVIGYTNKRLRNNEKAEIESLDYGALLYALYELGRIDENQYKPLVHCLMAYYSYELTRKMLLMSYNNTEEKKENKENKENYSIYSNLVVPEWEEQMLPSLEIKPESSETEELIKAEPPKIIPTNRTINLHDSKVVVNYLLNAKIDIQESMGKKKKEAAIKNYILYIEIMFLSMGDLKGADFKNGHWQLAHSPKKRIEGFQIAAGTNNFDWYFHIDGKKRLDMTGRFSIFNFVANSLDAINFLSPIETEMIDILGKHYEIDISRDDLMVSRYEEWEKSGCLFPLPVYWFDMFYNIVKRVRREMKQQNPVSIKKEEYFGYIAKIYKEIARHLKQQETIYRAHGQEDIYIYKQFVTCPYIDYFIEQNRNDSPEYKKGAFAELMNRL